MNTDLLDAYFAGLIDGEGSINVYPHKNHSLMRPNIRLNMTCETTVRSIHGHFGGSFSAKKVYNGNKPQWAWSVTWNKAVYIASRLRPYLITKAALADKILALPRTPLYLKKYG